MDKNLLKYIWAHSRREQIVICLVALASLPFYFLSLDLPRRIVNEAIQGDAFANGKTTARFLAFDFHWPVWLGGGRQVLFEGFEVGRIGLLFGLSFLFLFFVLINGAFKYWINVEKGALGERMLRRMRFDLFSLILRFTPQALRRAKASEMATIIKDEVEPIGGFIGDAFILPAFLGMQALTALFFIIIQNAWLGLMAVAMVGVQFIVIPRLRRKLLKLSRKRQVASRQLAGRVGEVFEGLDTIRSHAGQQWEQAEFGDRLYELFAIRFDIYRRKFLVKYLNNLLAQITPFLFYAIGGYLALMNRLDIGQLVAVINAYRELPPPLKELIDWDQQRLDVQVKYDQAIEQFSPDRLLPLVPAESKKGNGTWDSLAGQLLFEGVTIRDSHAASVVENLSFCVDVPAKIAIRLGSRGIGSFVAQVLARRCDDYSGIVEVGKRNLSDISEVEVGCRFAYAGADEVLFSGSIRDNLVYGLRHAPKNDLASNLNKLQRRTERRRLDEARRTGNPGGTAKMDWVDFAQAGVKDKDELDRKILKLLKGVGLSRDMYKFGLAETIDGEEEPALAARLVDARKRLQERLRDMGMIGLVEPYDPERYNRHATIAENLLFGAPLTKEWQGAGLAENNQFRRLLDQCDLQGDLITMGVHIAETMVEIFRGVPSSHPLFEQFSFINADELGEYETLVRTWTKGKRRFSKEERIRLFALPLSYIEPRHRLGLLDEALQRKLLAARKILRETFERTQDKRIEFYDAERICTAVPLKNNLVFGRVSHEIANAQSQVAQVIGNVIDELDLREAVERIGLRHQVGPSGRLLTAEHRAGIDLVRCLIKQPDLLVLDGVLAAFPPAARHDILQALLRFYTGKTLIAVLPDDASTDGFDTVITLEKRGTAQIERNEAPDGVAPNSNGARSRGDLAESAHAADKSTADGLSPTV